MRYKLFYIIYNNVIANSKNGYTFVLQLTTKKNNTTMTTKISTTKNPIVAFHIGRGGSFNNQGHLSFIGEQPISNFINDLFLNHENQDSFNLRYGFDTTSDDQLCILDLISNEDYEQLEEAFGITKEMLGERIYLDCGGNPVGLSESQMQSGIGCINIDNDYDTTYTCYLNECSESEIYAIENSDYFDKDYLLSLLND